MRHGRVPKAASKTSKTKDRNQFNCYLTEEYADYLRFLSTKKNVSIGEFIESLLELYRMDTLNPVISRLTERLTAEDIPEKVISQLPLLAKRVESLISANASPASPSC